MPKRRGQAKVRLERLPSEICLRGRTFSQSELKQIRTLVNQYSSEGRTCISKHVCEALDWKQPNGWLKDRACRDVLRALNTLKLIRLPEPKIVKRTGIHSKYQPATVPKQIDETVVTEISEALSLRFAKGNADEKLWNSLVQQYHYLGHKVTVGRCIKFLIFSGTTILGAISLADSAWHVKDRDSVIRYFGWKRESIANNSRFLILPHVRVKNLASRSLALLATEGVRVWNEYYACELECLETFVDTLRFVGTSYKAANWSVVGKTKGYRKSGASFHNSQTPKFIFIYPLCSRSRNELRRLRNECI